MTKNEYTSPKQELVISMPSSQYHDIASEQVKEAGGELISMAQASRVEQETLLLPSISKFYFARGVKESKLQGLRNLLFSIDGVDAAYIKPVAEVCIRIPINRKRVSHNKEAKTNRLTNQQQYLGPSPGGVDAVYAWTQPGGTGYGVEIIDIEGGWNKEHQDLDFKRVYGKCEFKEKDHGTAVAGVVAANPKSLTKDDTFRVTGIACESKFSAVSIHSFDSASCAIVFATNKLKKEGGGVLLIELHRPFNSRQDQVHIYRPWSKYSKHKYIPVEWWPDEFEAIKAATEAGIVVVEAAGNGSQDLDDDKFDDPKQGHPSNNFPPNWVNPFRRLGDNDSGSIIVGAGAPPTRAYGRNQSRLSYSNYGSCIDAQGWGEDVVSTGYGDKFGRRDPNIRYTKEFSGTSSAAAMVAGVAACLQGICFSKYNTFLKPKELRKLFKDQAVNDCNFLRFLKSQEIGKRPDLRELIKHL